MADITITTNFPDVSRKLASMRKEIADRAIASAINKTVDQARTAMVREITSEFNLTAGFVRQRLRVTRARARPGQLVLEAALIGSAKRRSANVIRFVERFVSLAQARSRAKGGTQNQLRFKFKKRGNAKLIEGSFIGNKGRTVFQRTGEERLPIDPVQVIGVPQMFTTRKINAAVRKLINDRFGLIFEREARFFTERFSAAR